MPRIKFFVLIFVLCEIILHSRYALASLEITPETPEEYLLRNTVIVQAVNKIAPAVVNIVTTKSQTAYSPFGNTILNPFIEDFFKDDLLDTKRVKATSLGSGVIIDGNKGLVITNAHVIAGASVIDVRLQDGRQFKAELVGSGPDFDLAVLRLPDAKNLPEVNLGDSNQLMPGETVIAVGNPFGFNHTITTGVISALGRSIKTKNSYFTDLIQTDAAINPGNSGGPLVNLAGRVIGINSAMLASAEGIGFAIPAAKILNVVGELIGKGSISPAWIGIYGQDLEPQLASWLGLKSLSGMLVTDVDENGPTAKTGIMPGDVVLKFNGQVVNDKAHFQLLTRSLTPRDKITLEIWRNNSFINFSFQPVAFSGLIAEKFSFNKWGVIVTSGNGVLKILKVRPNSSAARVGLKKDDIIRSISGINLKTVDDFNHAINNASLDNKLMLIIGRGSDNYYVLLSDE